MTDTFQGGKGLSGKIERLIWKRADTEKRSKKGIFLLSGLTTSKRGSTMIRPVSNCWKKVDKRLTKSNHFVTSGKQESDQYLTDENPEKKADWQAWLQQWLVDWGKKQIWTRRKQGFDLYLSKRKSRKKSWLRVVGWLKEAYLATDWPWIDLCPPKNVLKPELTDRLDNSGWLTERKLGCTSIANHRWLLHHRTSDIHNFKTTKNYQRRVIDINWCTKNEMLTILYNRYQVQIQTPHNYLIKIAYTSQNLIQTVNI